MADTKLAIERIPMFLNPKNDAHKRFKALAARKTDAVPRYPVRAAVPVAGAGDRRAPYDAPIVAAIGGWGWRNRSRILGRSSSTEATSTA